MRLWILSIVYVILTPLCVALLSHVALDEYRISYWLGIIEFIFIISAIKHSWLIRILAGVAGALMFPITSQLVAELLFDKGEGLLRSVGIDNVAYFFLFIQTITLAVLFRLFKKQTDADH